MKTTLQSLVVLAALSFITSCTTNIDPGVSAGPSSATTTTTQSSATPYYGGDSVTTRKTTTTNY